SHVALSSGHATLQHARAAQSQYSCGFARLRTERAENPFGRLYILRSDRVMVSGAVSPPRDRRCGDRKGFICRKKLIDTMFARG
ncbi:MAG: hypothetical protein KGJ46_13360, partial [Xanthomonadaceae bacterium]|nr:hypothetical protein [Xanthomonadaceae bacterium]